MTKILGLSAKKQGGKNTSANFIVGTHMWAVNLVSAFKITDKGKLWINDLEGDKRARGVLDLESKDPNVEGFKQSKLNEYIQIYSFADLLKKNVCMDVLGLTEAQCYGTDEDKSSLTHLKWEDMPHYYQPLPNLQYHEPGPMTAREVLQYVGTDLFRKMYGGVWVDALMRKIESDNSDIAIVSDVRFPNEVEGIQKTGGKVVRFTRSPLEDSHDSETALDSYDGFDFTIDNENMDIMTQNISVYDAIFPHGYMPFVDFSSFKVNV